MVEEGFGEYPPYKMSVPDEFQTPVETPPWPHMEKSTAGGGISLIGNLTRELYDEVRRGLPEGKLAGQAYG